MEYKGKETCKEYLHEVTSEKAKLYKRFIAGDKEVFERLIDCLEITQEIYRGEVYIRVLITTGGPGCWINVYGDKCVGHCVWGSDRYRRVLGRVETRAFQMIAGI